MNGVGKMTMKESFVMVVISFKNVALVTKQIGMLHETMSSLRIYKNK